MKIKFAVLVISLLIVIPNNVISNHQPSIQNLYINAKLPDETFELSSEITSKTYNIEVHLPYDYEENLTQGYPVLYFPNHLFHNPATGNVINHYDMLNEWLNFTSLFENDVLPRILIIGVTDLQFSDSRYKQDLITNTDDFYLFFEEELIPYIDQTYNTNINERILAGWEQSCFFVLETFFRYPNTIFNKFVSVEGHLYPASQTTDGLPDLIHKEEDLFNRIGAGGDVDLDLFLGASNDEHNSYTPFKELTSSIFRRNYNMLNLRTELFNQIDMFGYAWYTGLGIWQNYNTIPYAAYQIENQDVYVGEEVLYTFAGSLGNRTEVEFYWDFDDGTSSTERSPSHIYTIAGEYRTNLTITDEYNITSSYVIPGGLKVYPGNRPIEAGETTYNLRNTESYKRRDTNVDETPFSNSWLIILPIIVVVNLKIRKKNIVFKEK